jgi:hypothetical protein
MIYECPIDKLKLRPMHVLLKAHLYCAKRHIFRRTTNPSQLIKLDNRGRDTITYPCKEWKRGK